MSSAIDAQTGLWPDYSRHLLDRWQVLVTDFWLRGMTAFVAIALTVISPCVYKIARVFIIFALRLLGRFGEQWHQIRASRPIRSQSLAEEQTGLLSGQQSSQDCSQQHGTLGPSDTTDDPQSSTGQSDAPNRQHGDRVDRAESSAQCQACGRKMQACNGIDRRDTVHMLKHSESSRGFVANILMEVEAPHTTSIVVATILFGLFVCLAIANIFSADIASNRLGLSSSETCGIWQFDDAAGEEAAARDDLHNYQKEMRASQYARSCYNSPDSASTLSCKIFYNQSIAYKTYADQRCPFASPEICYGGLYSAVTFDTGLVDASIIGINAPSTYHFQRTTTCSPLNISKKYVKLTPLTENKTEYRYFYGPKDISTYTFNTSGHPFEWLIPAYSVNTYFSSLYPELDYWHPIPELKSSENSTLTIMFVSSMHVYQTQRNEDPIFPATTPRYFPGLRDPYYFNIDPRARPLACVDETRVCSPHNSDCWSMTAPAPPDAASDPAYWLMKWSLENSDSYDAIKWRLGTALLAQQSVSQSVTNPSSPLQWQSEADALFATSLATIQYDAWGIATGEDRERPGYVEVTPDEARGSLCKKYKFKTEDYTNVNFAAFVGLPLIALVIFVLSWDRSTAVYCCCSCCRKAWERDANPDPDPLVIEMLIELVWRLATYMSVALYQITVLCCKKSKHCFEDTVDKIREVCSKSG